MRWPRGPMHRRAQWPGYRPARSGLSTPIVKKMSYRSQEFCDAKKSLCFGALAALEPHSCDVLTTRYALNRRAPAGADAAYFTYRDRRSINPLPSHTARKLREICSPLTFETLAGLLVWPLIPEFPCVRQCPAPEPFPERDENVGSGLGEGLCRMSMEFGGTQG
jgi:hypothetical protein